MTEPKPFNLKKPEEAEIVVAITGSHRQCGTTSVAHIVAKALADAGFKNVKLQANDAPDSVPGFPKRMAAPYNKVGVLVQDAVVLKANSKLNAHCVKGRKKHLVVR